MFWCFYFWLYWYWEGGRRDCFELYWIWLTVWFGLHLNFSRVKASCYLFPIPHKNLHVIQKLCYVWRQMQELPLSSFTNQPTGSANSQPPFFHSSVWHCSVVFSTLSKCISTGVKIQQDLGAFARVWKCLFSEVHGRQMQQLSKPQVTWERGVAVWGGCRTHLVSSSHFFQTGVDHWECTSPVPLMCAPSARTPAGSVAVLGYFTKMSGIHKLLKSAHGLK